MPMCMYICILTYVHTHKLTDIQTEDRHAYIYAYVHKCIYSRSKAYDNGFVAG